MKKQYRVGDDIDVQGLISTLRKTDPAGVKNLEHRGGRLGGKAMANDNKRHDPNGSRRIKDALKMVSGG